MDQLDRELIRLLQKDSRLSFTSIAKELKKPDTTVHFRMRKLIKDGIVSRFSALVKPEAFGYGCAGLFRIEIGGHILPEISKERTSTFAREMAEDESYLLIAVDEEPMTIHAVVMGTNGEDIEKRANALRKSPDVVKVIVTRIDKVVKGWEVTGSPLAESGT